MDFKLEQRVKTIVTEHLDDTLVDILALRDYWRPMVVIDKFLLTTHLIQELFLSLSAAEVDFFVYDEVIPDPPMELVDKGAELFKLHHCDSIVAIGGGSSIDCARGINIVRTLGGEIRDYAFDHEVSEFCPGLIAVPTTSGTGSELSNALIVTDSERNEKLAVLADNAVSEFAVLAPALVVSLPKNMTIATGLDTFAHAAEGYTSNLSSPVTDAICEKVMFLVAKYLPKAVANGDDLEARERMMVAAALGGWLLNNAGTHVGHSQAHVIGSRYHIPHGMACAYALPGALKYTAPVKVKKVREIGLILGAEFPEDPTDLEVGAIVAERFRDFRDNELGLTPFESFNVSREELLSNAEDVAKERFAGNSPMPITVDMAKTLLSMFG